MSQRISEHDARVVEIVRHIAITKFQIVILSARENIVLDTIVDSEKYKNRNAFQFLSTDGEWLMERRNEESTRSQKISDRKIHFTVFGQDGSQRDICVIEELHVAGEEIHGRILEIPLLHDLRINSGSTKIAVSRDRSTAIITRTRTPDNGVHLIENLRPFLDLHLGKN